MQSLRRGATGASVAEVRDILAQLGLLANADPARLAVFDDATELALRHFQQRRGISVNGTVGTETWNALCAARFRLGDRELRTHPDDPYIGDDVTELQVQLLEMGYDLGRADGIFGPATDRALRCFQADYGVTCDGICGPATLRALRQLGRRVVGGRPQMLRELAAVSAAGPSLIGRRVVLDPGHGGSDFGASDGTITEAEVVWDLAGRLEARLAAIGVTTWLTRGEGECPADRERAYFANDVGADLMLSLHVDQAPSPYPNGIASYHYAGAESSSTIGERLADLAQRELVARTGLLNARVHGKTWATLRLTRMPSVRVEIGYLSSPRDRARLIDASFRDTVAEGLLVAVQRLYLPKADDPPTGVMRIPAGAA